CSAVCAARGSTTVPAAITLVDARISRKFTASALFSTHLGARWPHPDPGKTRCNHRVARVGRVSLERVSLSAKFAGGQMGLIGGHSTAVTAADIIWGGNEGLIFMRNET